jgi:hydrogenase nickel incorporation protein HypA/HybF
VHELSICQAMLTQVEGIAREHSAQSVTRITLRVGSLSGVDPELLRHAFPLASAGTVAEGAELCTETLPLRVHCRTCGAQTEAAANRLLCGVCRDYRTDLVSGDELLLASVELATGLGAQ